MRLPMQISFKNMPRSTEIEDIVYERATTLDAFSRRIMSCRVVIDVPHGHHERGNLYQVRVDITVPGEELVVNREATQHTQYKDVQLAISEAFATAARLLEDYERRQRGAVKQHAGLPHARVARIFPEAGYGFLETPDSREIYFHRNSVLNQKFGDLEVGTEVAFDEEEGDRGPQASTVRIVGRHSHL